MHPKFHSLNGNILVFLVPNISNQHFSWWPQNLVQKQMQLEHPCLGSSDVQKKRKIKPLRKERKKKKRELVDFVTFLIFTSFNLFERTMFDAGPTVPINLFTDENTRNT